MQFFSAKNISRALEKKVLCKDEFPEDHIEQPLVAVYAPKEMNTKIAEQEDPRP